MALNAKRVLPVNLQMKKTVDMPPTTIMLQERTAAGHDVVLSFQDHAVHEAMAFAANTDAYFQAVAFCPSVIESESPHDMYLMYHGYNVWEASQRLADYWTLRVEMFGTPSAFFALPLTMQPKDIEYLLKGSRAMLPRHKDGRCVWVSDRNKLKLKTQYKELQSRLRSLFFFLQKAMMETWEGFDVYEELYDRQQPLRKRGECMMLQRVNNDRITPVGSDFKFMSYARRLSEAMCVKITQIHCVSVNPPSKSARAFLFGQALRKQAVRISCWLAAIPLEFHMGQPSDLIKSLEAHGFERDGLPKFCGGTWTYENDWRKWLQDNLTSQSIQAIELQLLQKTNQSSLGNSSLLTLNPTVKLCDASVDTTAICDSANESTSSSPRQSQNFSRNSIFPKLDLDISEPPPMIACSSELDDVDEIFHECLPRTVDNVTEESSCRPVAGAAPRQTTGFSNVGDLLKGRTDFQVVPSDSTADQLSGTSCATAFGVPFGFSYAAQLDKRDSVAATNACDCGDGSTSIGTHQILPSDALVASCTNVGVYVGGSESPSTVESGGVIEEAADSVKHEHEGDDETKGIGTDVEMIMKARKVRRRQYNLYYTRRFRERLKVKRQEKQAKVREEMARRRARAARKRRKAAADKDRR